MVCNQAELKLAFTLKEIQIEVEDNDVGFVVPKSLAEFAPCGHFGLLDVHERADLIGAKLEVFSTPGKGTRLRVSL